MGKRRRGHSRKHATVSTVKAIVKKEVNKTREAQKLVSYVSWSRMNDIMAGSGEDACIYSITGGLNPLLSGAQDPQSSGTSIQEKSLFAMLPANYTTLGGTLQGVGQAGQGGTVNQQSGVGGFATATIGNVHQLEGRQAYLKSFYATIGLNNGTTGVNTPTNQFIRILVVETRRPLSTTAVNQQILLENHAVPAMNGAVPVGGYPTSALGYLNRASIKKVYYDKCVTLNAGAGASASLKRFKIKIRLNKKMHWSYFYPTRDPASAGEKLIYQGPFIYLIMWASDTQEYGDAWPAGGISALRQPRFALNSILTFYDD